ncbi:MAG: IS30 family transposase [Actinomycetota bacterium]|nr:IS30 family transposase [Actinomycetota bacterium]
MAGRGRPGSEPQAEKRQEFVRLVHDGISISEASRRVGINRKTGMRWRHGRTITTSHGVVHQYPSVFTQGEKTISARYLSENERVRIADLAAQGAGVRQIARELGRSPSTISRELRRNRDEGTAAYRPFAAHRAATRRRARPGRGKLRNDATLRSFVEERLKKRWSPEQIARALREHFVEQREYHLAPETIYQAVYRTELGGLCRELPAVLRTRRRRRRPRRRAEVRNAGSLVRMTMIAERPKEADDRRVPGHWEGDLIVGAHNRSAIGTLVERASRFTLLIHLPGPRHSAEVLRDALVAQMERLPPELRRSLTWDQGKEMALHAEIAAALSMPVFFCDAHSPWQRPTNENTNGLLRQYFPKGTDLRVYGPEDLAAVAAEVNARPRKVLSWQSPAERLSASLRN